MNPGFLLPVGGVGSVPTMGTRLTIHLLTRQLLTDQPEINPATRSWPPKPMSTLLLDDELRIRAAMEHDCASKGFVPLGNLTNPSGNATKLVRAVPPTLLQKPCSKVN